MEARANTRFCNSCQKYVHDFASMTHQEALRVIDESEGKLCGRIVRNAAGEIQFRPEPESKLLQRIVQISALGAGLLGSKAMAQDSSCKLEIRATDQSGKGIHKASITLGQSDKVLVEGKTSPEGSFAAQLPAGTYQLGVEALGYEYFTHDPLQLQCDPAVKQEFQAGLTLAGVGQTVSVEVMIEQDVVMGELQAMIIKENPLRHSLRALRRTVRRIFQRA